MWAAARIVFAKEVRELLRDRRVVLYSLVLPVMVLPALLLVLQRGEERERRRGAVAIVRIALEGPGAAELAGLLTLPGARFRLVHGGRAALLDGRIDLWVHVGLAGRPQGPLALVRYNGARRESQAGRERLRDALDRLREKRLAGWAGAVGLPLARVALPNLVALDVAPEPERAAARLARLMPLILVLLLLSGSSFAAVDLIAGERERGTLETLYLTQYRPLGLVLGKAGVVFAMALISAGLNLASLLVTAELGLAPGALGRLDAASVAAAASYAPPLGLLLGALTMWVTAYSRSYKEAQVYLLPLILGCMVPALASSAPGFELGALSALVPIAGPALALREVLQKPEASIAHLLAWVSTWAYGALALQKVTQRLCNEESLLSAPPPPLRSASSTARLGRPVGFALLLLLGLYYLLAPVQARYPGLGLALTLWGWLLPATLSYARIFHRPLRESLLLRAPRWSALAGTVLLAPALTAAMTAYARLQDRVLPVPAELRELLDRQLASLDLTLPVALLLMAISPAVCEELLFRGLLFSELGRRSAPISAGILSAVLFAAFHLSVYRFIGQALLGLLLAWVVARSGSILPGMLLHAWHNGVLILALRGGLGFGEADLEAISGDPWTIASVLLLAGIGVILLSGKR